jgi:hypothetical protein
MHRLLVEMVFPLQSRAFSLRAPLMEERISGKGSLFAEEYYLQYAGESVAGSSFDLFFGQMLLSAGI